MSEHMKVTDEEWKQCLSPQQFDVLRLKRTERPFTGEYLDNHETGVFKCAACGMPLFSSERKFESGSGWPSFDEAIDDGNVELHEDHSHFMVRTEVTCGSCGGHLGHLFDDGPTETGKRYCVNSVALMMEPSESTS